MRATLTQEYDEGITGRFGNQLRSIPMLPGLAVWFGPLVSAPSTSIRTIPMSALSPMKVGSVGLSGS